MGLRESDLVLDAEGNYKCTGSPSLSCVRGVKPKPFAHESNGWSDNLMEVVAAPLAHVQLEGACGKPQQSLSDTYETMSGCVGSPAQRLPEAGRCCQGAPHGYVGRAGWEAAASGPKTPLTNSSSSSSSLVAAGSVCSASSSSGDASLSSESSSTSTSEPLAMRSSSTSNSSSSSCWTFSFSLPLFGAGSDEANPNSAASSPTSSLPKASLAPSDCSFSPPAGPASSSSSSETGSPLILFALLSSSSFKRRASSLAFSSAVFVRSEGLALLCFDPCHQCSLCLLLDLLGRWLVATQKGKHILHSAIQFIAQIFIIFLRLLPFILVHFGLGNNFLHNLFLGLLLLRLGLSIRGVIHLILIRPSSLSAHEAFVLTPATIFATRHVSKVVCLEIVQTPAAVSQTHRRLVIITAL
ncbi:hypothetical protein KC320_g210 [Hortaea werneckii]|nr:hypothetical protein KC320_g210 [Hortaea werneckii]